MINADRIKELREWVEEVRFNDQADMLGDISANLLAILDALPALRADVIRLQAENERLSKQHDQCHDRNTALVQELWDLKARAEKAEAELNHRCDQRDAALESVGLLSAELEAENANIKEAANDLAKRVVEAEALKPRRVSREAVYSMSQSLQFTAPEDHERKLAGMLRELGVEAEEPK